MPGKGGSLRTRDGPERGFEQFSISRFLRGRALRPFLQRLGKGLLDHVFAGFGHPFEQRRDVLLFKRRTGFNDDRAVESVAVRRSGARQDGVRDDQYAGDCCRFGFSKAFSW